tara:strand:+ start:94 stop:663 length:570 start_codon:yes stop_codon:yes gene_type:complete
MNAPQNERTWHYDWVKKLFSILSCLLLIGCGKDSPLDESGWTNDQYGIGLDPPQGWAVDESGTLGLLVQFTKALDDGSAVAINLMGPAELGGGSLMEAAKQSVQIGKTLLNNYTLISQQSTTVSSMSAWQITSSIDAGGSLVKQRSVMVENNGVMYPFTFAAKSAHFDTYAPMFDKLLQSLIITGASSP